MDALMQQFRETAQQKCRIEPGKLLVAVSGGSDSVALLILLHRHRELLAIEPVVAHIDHGLRPESSADAGFVRELANSLQLPFVCRQVRVREAARRRKSSLESAARDLRHQALLELADAQGCHDIAYGHTAGDQAETVLLNLARGAGLRGLAGMPYRFGRRVRPLLDQSRDTLRDFLQAAGISYREDASNRQLHFRRNLIRQQVLPYLESSLNPKMAEVLCRLAAHAAETEAFVQQEAGRALAAAVKETDGSKIVLDIKQFSSYYSLVRKYIIRNSLEMISHRAIRPSTTALSRVDQLITTGHIGKRVRVHPDWEVLIDHDGVVVWDGKPERFEVTCKPGQEVVFEQNRRFKSSIVSPSLDASELKSDADNQFVDAAKISGELHIRSYLPGDRFFPLGLDGSKRVSDLFADAKVPLHRRHRVPIVACDTGIIWIAGLQLDNRFRLTPHTRHILHLQVQDSKT